MLPYCAQIGLYNILNSNQGLRLGTCEICSVQYTYFSEADKTRHHQQHHRYVTVLLLHIFFTALFHLSKKRHAVYNIICGSLDKM